jgi:hypothetical protein
MRITSVIDRIKDWPVHPYLFAVFWVLFYYALMVMTWTPIHVMLLPIVVLLVCAAIVHLLSICLLRDVRRAALYTTLLILTFFMTTFVSSIIEQLSEIQININPDVEGRYTVWALWVLLLAGFYFCLFSKKPLFKVTQSINEIALFLVTLETMVIGYHVIQTKFIQFPHVEELTHCASTPSAVNDRPDIYYVILDEMASPRIMKELFNYDNTPFQNYLKSKGFYIPEHSRANYPRTEMSLSCSLNMTYLDKVVTVCGAHTTDVALLTELIMNNRVAHCLKDLGYKFVNVSSGVGPTEWIPYADVNITLKPFFGWFMTNLLQSSMFGFCQPGFDFLDELNREQRRATFRGLIEASKIPGPKFVFCHILLPHDPFIFNADGSPTTSLTFVINGQWSAITRKAYANQEHFAETQIAKAIDEILASSKKPPIMILQGDHGTFSMGTLTDKHPSPSLLKERLSLFNAYLLPGKGPAIVYSTITPVNSFRSIFNGYFGMNLPILEDKSFYSVPPNYLLFTDETKTVSDSPQSK